MFEIIVWTDPSTSLIAIEINGFKPPLLPRNVPALKIQAVTNFYFYGGPELEITFFIKVKAVSLRGHLFLFGNQKSELPRTNSSVNKQLKHTTNG